MFNKGDTVYTDDGRKCVFVSSFEGGAVVHPLYERDDDCEGEDYEPFAGEPCIVDRVHAAPPRAVRDETIAALDAEIEVRTARLRELQADEVRIADGAKRHATLARILDYLDGRFTHYVYYYKSTYGRGGYQIIDGARSNQPGQHDKPLRIPVRRGWGGALEFTNDDYYDRDVWYCRSLDEARAKALELLDAAAASAIESQSEYSLAEIAENYSALKMEAPARIGEAIAAIKRVKVEEEARKAAAEAERARAKLAALG